MKSNEDNVKVVRIFEADGVPQGIQFDESATTTTPSGINWQELLILVKKNKPLAVLANVITALSCADEWKGPTQF